MNVVNVKNTAEPITPVEKIGGCKTAGELLAALGGGQLRTTAGVRILGEYPLESIQDLDWTPPAAGSQQDQQLPAETKSTLDRIEGALNRVEGMFGFYAVDVKTKMRPTSSKVSSGRNKHFRQRLLRAYKINIVHGASVPCVVTSFMIPPAALRAGHLFPLRLRAYAKVFAIQDLNSVRNGLLWCDFIENAYESWRICFSFGLTHDEFILHVVAADLLDTPLYDLCSTPGEPEYKASLAGRKFRDLDGRKFVIAGQTQPMKRVLAWQAAGAIDMAKERGNLSPNLVPDQLRLEVTSEYEGKGSLLGWLQQCEMAGPSNAAPLPGVDEEVEEEGGGGEEEDEEGESYEGEEEEGKGEEEEGKGEEEEGKGEEEKGKGKEDDG